MEKFFEKDEKGCFFKSLGAIVNRRKERHSGGAIATEESHNLECPSAQDYDVASYSKLNTMENNSSRNDTAVYSPAGQYGNSTNIKKENKMKPLIDLSTYQSIDIKKVKNLSLYSLNALVPNKKEPAFTLAEVLITLGIIGIVAAMTIPNLITNYQKKQTALEVKKAYTELNQILKMAIADYGEPSGWDYYKANELSLWVQTYFEPYVKVSGAETCSDYKNCLGVPMYYPLKSATRSANLNGQYVVVKLGSPFAYVFSRYEGNYEPVTRVRAYIRNPRNLRAYVGKDVFTFILTTVDSNPMFKPYGFKPLGSYGISTNDRKILLSTGWGGCNPKASGSGYWTPGDACAAVIMLDGWKINKDYPW